MISRVVEAFPDVFSLEQLLDYKMEAVVERPEAVPVQVNCQADSAKLAGTLHAARRQVQQVICKCGLRDADLAYTSLLLIYGTCIDETCDEDFPYQTYFLCLVQNELPVLDEADRKAIENFLRRRTVSSSYIFMPCRNITYSKILLQQNIILVQVHLVTKLELCTTSKEPER